MKWHIARALGAAVLLAAMGTAISAAPESPVQINHLYVSLFNGTSMQPGAFEVSFVNQAPVTASDVQIHVTDASGYTAAIDDVGSFAPGVTINHTYSLYGIGAGAYAQVVGVTFVDGTTWSAELPAQPAPLPQAPAGYVEPL